MKFDGFSASTANNGLGTSRRSACTAIHVWGSKWPTWKGMDGVSCSSTCVLRLQEGETAAVEDLWAVIRACLRKAKQHARLSWEVLDILLGYPPATACLMCSAEE